MALIVDGLEINYWSRDVITEVRSGGVNVVHATIATWEDTAQTMTAIGSFRHLCRHNADLIRIVRSVADVHQAVEDDVLAIVLGFQNSSMLGDDVEMAGIFADLGIRVVQLTYNIANHMGSSCWEPVDGGLTRAGARMVEALNSAGILVDISHVGDRTGREAAEASSKPIAITHGNPRSFCDTPRNKQDDTIRAVTERGGVIGCTLYPLFMGGAATTRHEYCTMMADLAETHGVEHVAVGSDAVLGWDANALGWMRNGRWNRPTNAAEVPEFPDWPSWFDGPKDFQSLAEGLAEVGFEQSEVDAILGENWMRLFGEVFP